MAQTPSVVHGSKRERNVGSKASSEGRAVASGEPCAVCGMRDSRVLVAVDLESGITASLCANHELMYLRSNERPATIEELRATFAERRDMDRRARPEGEVDELAANLTAAFITERRTKDRRA